MEHTKEIILENGYKWFNGLVLSDTMTAKYNNFTTEIDRYSENPTQFADKIETIKNLRHEYLIMCFDIISKR